MRILLLLLAACCCCTCHSSTASDARHRTGFVGLQTSEKGDTVFPYFSLPKALDPLLAICLHALMNGTTQGREVAADTIGEIINLSEAASLKPYLIKTTGPLIRVVGDRFPSSVKSAILKVSGEF